MKFHHRQTLFKKTLKSERGIATILVLSVIAILTAILADFMLESKLNSIKSTNYLQQLQARLNAESGIRLAMAKLKLYQAARNTIEKNKDLKKSIKPGILEKVVLTPFAYPIPVPPSANLIQKSAIEEFAENTIMEGELIVTMSTVKGFLNPNSMRIVPPKNDGQNNNDDIDPDERDKKAPHVIIYQQLIKEFTRVLEKEDENNEDYDFIYGDVEPRDLVDELRYYVNHPSRLQDVETGEAEAAFVREDIRPKQAPMTSLSELYLLPSWTDAIVDIIKNRLTVHESAVILPNEIDESHLRTIFPDITDEQVKDFFEYRDGNEEDNKDPNEFKSVKDFESVVTDRLAIIDKERYRERIKELSDAGIKIGISGKLFKVTSVGRLGRASFTLTAFVDLPIKPPPPPPPKKPQTNKNDQKKDPDDPDAPLIGDTSGNSDQNDQDDPDKEKEAPPEELLEPRIVEIIIGR